MSKKIIMFTEQEVNLGQEINLNGLNLMVDEYLINNNPHHFKVIQEKKDPHQELFEALCEITNLMLEDTTDEYGRVYVIRVNKQYPYGNYKQKPILKVLTNELIEKIRNGEYLVFKSEKEALLQQAQILNKVVYEYVSDERYTRFENLSSGRVNQLPNKQRFHIVVDLPEKEVWVEGYGRNILIYDGKNWAKRYR